MLRPMQCTGFIDGYTDFKDGLLSPDREAVSEVRAL
jgi:hypothetical protein